jgi:tRNA threonylcarbamoyl adenosine modification protein YeaZ
MSSLALALHTSGSDLGLALLDGDDRRCVELPVGRALANALPGAVAELLPPRRWRELTWMAVALGPGSFTATRLGVVMARTIAQQVGCRLHGVGSFLLVARRRRGELEACGPVWIGQTLPRRGTVVGRYALEAGRPVELAPPRLEPGPCPAPFWEVDQAAAADALGLLELGLEAEASAAIGDWRLVLPLYPTAPVPLP